MLWLFVGPTGVCLLDFFCSGIRFCLLLGPCLCFVSLLCLGLCVLGDDALLSWRPFMQAKFYVSWSASELRERLAHRLAGLGPPVKYFTDRSGAVLLLWIFYVFVLSYVCYVFVPVCLDVLCGQLLGKG